MEKFLKKQTIQYYQEIDAEIYFCLEILDGLLSIKNAAKKFVWKTGSIDKVKSKVIKEAIEFEERIDRREKELTEELKKLAIYFLKKQHGINLGEKIPYNHINKNGSGYLIVEEVDLLLREKKGEEDLFYISGRRFNNDGQLGKRTEITVLSLDREICDK
jgi:hypothetical protein